ncbi:K, P-type ATPase (mediates high-affinity potassium or sodium uptake) [Sporisorium reilianum f. sp. reilianum]|uniref:K, P-type ATPase (Mediates high-affinity potassium or sodium uptake) n=1 Tax=Sporisorium reilianum f. sp. reilianum TaxID=72559 RepID=A0A2N8UJH8_9BASI|nr:K, P-type ATPase (mediates high-affinity potassium or sodium uptake) [Sporisorium reilianum f. sp. reilianum]
MAPLSRATSSGESSDEKAGADIERADASTARKLPRSLSFGANLTAARSRTTRFDESTKLERTHSIAASLRAPPRIDPSAKVPVEFRTLSIQLSHGGLADADARHKSDKRTVRELNDLDWHRISVDDVLVRTATSAQAGLDGAQVERRLKQYGRNVTSKPNKCIIRKIVGYVFGGFGTLLIGCSVLAFIAWKPLGNPNPQTSNLALAVVLLVVVVIQAVFNAWQDFSTSRIMDSIAGMLPDTVTVIRNGSHNNVEAAELVQGDIVVVSLGNKIAADLRLISCSEVKFDRSVTTGESEPLAGSVDMTDDNYLETRNIALAGTSCVSGSAIGVVVSTGDNTVFGRIAAMTNRPKSGLTTLEKEVRYFVLTIAAIAVALAVVCIIIWGAYLRPKHRGFMSVSQLLVNIVSILVAFLPEGMPVAVTLSLTVIAAKLSRAKILCKQLSTCETLGAVSVLCSDKTGTLTSNSMTATSVGVLAFESTPHDASQHVTTGAPVGHAFEQLQFVAAVCNAAVFDAATASLPVAERKIFGDATDSAVLRMAEEIRPVQETCRPWDQEYRLNFNSKNKFMLQLVSLRPEVVEGEKCVASAMSTGEAAEFRAGEDKMLLVKGGPDVLLKRSSSALDASGQVVALTEQVKDVIVAMQSRWSSRGQRVILLARRIVRAEQLDTTLAIEDAALALNMDLTVVGLVGIVDPPRPEIPAVVATCRGAGIRFFMVTGDYSKTAEAIARQCDIVTASQIHTFDTLHSPTLPLYDAQSDNDTRPQHALSLTGADLMKLSPTDWEQICRFDEIVFSRTTPENKLRIVREFQQRGECVGMTGDGVNDAPSLKQADIGIAMGGGSAVAMEAADMVLLDSFAAIVDALLYGRLVFVNLKKTVGYLLPAGSFAELWAVLLSFLFGLPQILSNLQMIFVCIGTDGVSSLCLVHEQPELDLLKRKPRSTKKDRLADWRLLLHAYVFVGIPLTLTSSAMAFWYMQRHGVPFSDMWLKYGGGTVQSTQPDRFNEVLYRANAVYFFNLVIQQWFNLLGWRTQTRSLFQQLPLGRKATQNVYLFPAMVVSLLIAVFFSYVPAFQHVFLTRGVSVEHCFLPVAFGVAMLLLEEARKLVVRKWPRSGVGKVAW